MVPQGQIFSPLGVFGCSHFTRNRSCLECTRLVPRGCQRRASHVEPPQDPGTDLLRPLGLERLDSAEHFHLERLVRGSVGGARCPLNIHVINHHVSRDHVTSRLHDSGDIFE